MKNIYQLLLLATCFIAINSNQLQAQPFGEPNTIIESLFLNLNYSSCFVDMDGDSDMDVLAYKQTFDSYSIVWYENTENGSFEPPKFLVTNLENDAYIYTADIDNDGDQDIFTYSFHGSDSVYVWYENNGNGSLGIKHIILPETLPLDYQILIFEDIDGDSIQDIVASSKDNKLIWYQNDGNGNFSTQQIIYNNLPLYTSIYTFDIDNDGDQDVISASFNDGKIAWYQNDGNGIFGTQQIITTQAQDVYSAYITDIDGDGDQDVISASSNDGKIAWYQNDGNENFGTQQIINTQAEGAFLVYASDIDNDGDQDIFYATSDSVYNNKKFSWLENDGNGSFSTEQIISTHLCLGSTIFATDINNDGYKDILTTSTFCGNIIAWFENDGNSNLDNFHLINNEITVIVSIFTTDIDDDSDEDIIAASIIDNKIVWFENDGNGNFSTQQIITTQAVGASSVYATDLDGDGDMEVLSASEYDNKIAWYKNDGNGNFSTQQIITTQAAGASSVYATDIDGDGDQDVLSASWNDNKIAWYQNDGNGNFGTQQIITTLSGFPYSVYTTDLDGDGDQDVISASSDDSLLAWYQNDGNGNFGTQQIISNEVYGDILIYTADFDSDGDQDVLYMTDSSNIVWFENDGIGNFNIQHIIDDFEEYSNSILFSIDIDGDGDQDVLATSKILDSAYNFIESKAVWYENDGIGNFGTQQIIDNDTNLFNIIYATDIDGDGDQDVLTTTFYNNKIAWYENYLIIKSTIAGKVFNDENNNGIKDANEVFLNNVEIYIEPNDTVLYTNQQGIFRIFLEELGTYNITASMDSSIWHQTTLPIEYVINLSDTTNIDSLLFGFSKTHLVSGKVFYDKNENGIKEASEEYINHVEVIIVDSNLTEYTNTQGAFNFYLEQGTYTIIAKMDSNWYQTTTPIEFVITVTDSTNIDSLLFGFNKIQYIAGKVFYDENGDGIKDSSEVFLNLVEINIEPNRASQYTNSQGEFKLILEPGTYTISAKMDDANWYQTTNPANYLINFTDTTYIDSLLFGFNKSNLINDLVAIVFPQAYPRCGTTVPFLIKYYNNGTSVINNGSVAIKDIVNYTLKDTSANTPIDSISGNEIFWFFEDLYPSENRTIIQYFTIANQDAVGDFSSLNVQACFPILNNNATNSFYSDFDTTGIEFTSICHCTGAEDDHYAVMHLPFSAIDGTGFFDYFPYDCDIIPITDIDGDGDIDADDCKAKKPYYDEVCFTYRHQEIIRCSFDPNDKQANPVGEGDDHLAYKDENIIYTIRFQNTGNDTAFHVQITDSLDANLDINSFKFIAASHNNIQIQKQTHNAGTANEYHELIFTFHPIILLDSATNEVASQGFVSFSIQPKDGITDNTVIENTAEIVFDRFTDYPVITNTVTHTLVSDLRVTTAILEQKYEVGINAYPNPFTNSVNITLNKPTSIKAVTISVVDIAGKRQSVYTNITQDNLAIDLSQLANGVYFIAVEDANNNKLIGIQKIVKE